jgi:hypothetical protein
MEASMKVHGRCHCGQITYEADLDPNMVGVCNCTDCQMLTGTAFRVSARVAGDKFRLLTGNPKSYVKVAESGNRRVHSFCPDCGTPVFARPFEDPPATYSLRIGCLDERANLPPKMQIWCASALPWATTIADLPGRDRQ